MRIEKLSLKNFRGFEELEIEFPNKGNSVFIGINGSGKSSILDCIANCFRNFQLELLKGSGRTRSITKFFDRNEVNMLADEYSASILQWVYNAGNETRMNTGFQLRKTQNPKVVFTSNTESAGLAKDIRGDIGFYKNSSIPILVYYPSERSFNKPKLNPINLNNVSQLTAWEGIFERFTDFDSFFTWFRSAEDYENEIRLNEDRTYIDTRLKAVRVSIEKILAGFSNPRVKRQPIEDLVINKNKVQLSITRLSHGEKTLFALIGDLARRLAIANPEMINPLMGRGVVLIDEIDLHLHPAWQRDIMNKMEQTFPNVQFIVTTHSPQVLSNVPRENVFILEDFKLREFTPHTFGRDSNSILYDLFGVEKRPEKSEKEISKLYKYIDANDRTKAEKQLEKIKKNLGSGDVEVLRAESYIDLMDD